MKRILSIDQSLSNAGWCIFEDTILVDYGVISSNKNEEIHQRVYYITQQLRELIKEVDLVVLEGLSFGSISTSARPLAHLFYQIQTEAWLLGVDCTELSPKALKKFATGNGNAKKADMFNSLPSKVRDKFKSSKYNTISKGLYDITDSWHLGMMAMSNLRYL